MNIVDSAYHFARFILERFADSHESATIRAFIESQLGTEPTDEALKQYTNQQYGELCSFIESLGIKDGIGLLCGLHTNQSEWSLPGYLTLTSENLGEAFRVACQYRALLGLALGMSLDIEEENAICRLNAQAASIRYQRHFVEDDFASTIFFIRSTVDGLESESPTFMSFSYSAPDYSEKYASLFQCDMEFESDADQMVFPATWLERPLRTADPALHLLIEQQCEEMSEKEKENRSLSKQIEFLLVASPKLFQGISVEKLSYGLRLSPRSLRRKLVQEGTTFRKLILRIRMELATSLLVMRKMRLSSIADLLGYNDLSSFSRAYKSFYGFTPRSVRQQANN